MNHLLLFENFTEHPFPLSKVKNLVYHYGDKEFDEFDRLFLATGNRYTVSQSFFFSDKPSNQGDYVYECLVDIRCPIIIDLNESDWNSEEAQEAIEWLIKENSQAQFITYLMDWKDMDEEEAEEHCEYLHQNADGAIFSNSRFSTDFDHEYLVFAHESFEHSRPVSERIKIVERKAV